MNMCKSLRSLLKNGAIVLYKQMLRQISKARLLEQVSLDSSGLELPSQGAMDIVITWKAPNLVKVLSYSQA